MSAKDLRRLYLDLLKSWLLRKAPGEDVEDEVRREGRDWPLEAETMIGRVRLDNVELCVSRAIEDGVPGDLIETGVWRGGAVILMRAVLAAYGVTDRSVWVADSFEGLPPADLDRHPQDKAFADFFAPILAVSMEEVQGNFARYGLLDDQVQFLRGWFRDTLPGAPIDRLAVLRLDGDLYGSTMDALTALYHRVSPGGFVIIDDYGCIPACAQAVTDFREARGIDDPIEVVDWTGVFWRKGALV